MSWVDDARSAWDEHRRRERDREQRAAAQTIDYVERLRDRLGARPAGAGRLGEQEHAVVEDGVVRLMCTAGNDLPSGVRGVELRAEVPPDDRSLPAVHVWLNLERRSPLGSGVPLSPEWVDRGPVETLADLGRALDPTVAIVSDSPEPQSVGDLLLTVLQGLVRDVVHDELDGRLGDGSP